LEDESIDAVCIGTWPNMHRTLTLAALAKDKHVLCEARMATNAQEAHDIRPPENLFHIRTLQSAVAVEIAYSLFEFCGYQVRHHGYEYSTPEWKSGLKSGDANPAAAKIKSQPDLLVYDSEINDVYEVEIKTTNQPSSRWRIRSADIDTFRYYHPDAILMVYVQHEYDFYVGPLRRIDWENIQTYTYDSHAFYEVDLGSSFLKPTTLFNQVTPNAYFPFLEGVKNTLAAY